MLGKYLAIVNLNVIGELLSFVYLNFQFETLCVHSFFGPSLDDCIKRFFEAKSIETHTLRK